MYHHVALLRISFLASRKDTFHSFLLASIVVWIGVFGFHVGAQAIFGDEFMRANRAAYGWWWMGLFAMAIEITKPRKDLFTVRMGTAVLRLMVSGDMSLEERGLIESMSTSYSRTDEWLLGGMRCQMPHE